MGKHLSGNLSRMVDKGSCGQTTRLPSSLCTAAGFVTKDPVDTQNQLASHGDLKVESGRAGLRITCIRPSDVISLESVERQSISICFLCGINTDHFHYSFDSHPRNRPWRPIGLWDVKDPTLSRQSGHRWR
jgi:hypothetical protein